MKARKIRHSMNVQNIIFNKISYLYTNVIVINLISKRIHLYLCVKEYSLDLIDFYKIKWRELITGLWAKWELGIRFNAVSG